MWSMKHVRGHSALDDYVVSVADKVSTCNIVQSIWSYFYNSWDFITICYILGLVKNYLLPLNVISTEELFKNGFLGFLFRHYCQFTKSLLNTNSAKIQNCTK